MSVAAKSSYLVKNFSRITLTFPLSVFYWLGLVLGLVVLVGKILRPPVFLNVPLRDILASALSWTLRCFSACFTNVLDLDAVPHRLPLSGVIRVQRSEWKHKKLNKYFVWSGKAQLSFFSAKTLFSLCDYYLDLLRCIKCTFLQFCLHLSLPMAWVGTAVERIKQNLVEIFLYACARV